MGEFARVTPAPHVKSLLGLSLDLDRFCLVPSLAFLRAQNHTPYPPILQASLVNAPDILAPHIRSSTEPQMWHTSTSQSSLTLNKFI